MPHLLPSLLPWAVAEISGPSSHLLTLTFLESQVMLSLPFSLSCFCRERSLPWKCRYPAMRSFLPVFIDSLARAAGKTGRGSWGRSAALLVGTFAFLGSLTANSITFAQFTDAGTQNFSLTNNADGSQTFLVNGPVQFSYVNIASLPASLQGLLSARLSLTATSNQNVGITTIAGAQYAYIGGFAGAFQFTWAGTGLSGNTDLLHGTFQNQTILLGVQGGQSATFSDSTSANLPTEVKFSSHLVSILAQQENFAISLSSLFDTQTGDAGFTVGGPGNTNVENFVASATGTFAADPVPLYLPEADPLNYLCAGGLLLLLWRGIPYRRNTRLSRQPD